jgi:hypothetical protein
MERSTEDAVGALAPDRLEAVVPKITTTILGGTVVGPAGRDAGGVGRGAQVGVAGVEAAQASEAEGPDAEAPGAEAVGDAAGAEHPTRSHRQAYLEYVGATIVVVAFALGENQVGLLAGAIVGVHAALRLIDQRIPFTFGDGFVGYRGDPRWPLGVQEDDDVHWNWKRPTAPRFRDRFP